MHVENEADWVLVEKARDGNERALQELIDRYKPLILSIQNRYYLQELELSDWFQESAIVLWEVVNRFDVTRTHAFGSYLKGVFYVIVGVIMHDESTRRTESYWSSYFHRC